MKREDKIVPLRKGIGGPVVGKAEYSEDEEGFKVSIFDLTPEGRALFDTPPVSIDTNVFDHAEVAPDERVIHKRSAVDGFPQCWTSNEEGIFSTSFKAAEVTCPDCINYMKD